MNDMDLVREILAKAGGANDNGAPRQAENGHAIAYHFHAPVTVNLFSIRPPRAETGPQPEARPGSPLAGQALRSPSQNRALLLTVPPPRF